MANVLIASALLLVSVTYVTGHARFLEPPSRNSAWRVGFPTPPDYNDHGESVWCGGRARSSNGKRCGICGDAPDAHKNNEVGGKYFTGTIVRSYRQGDTINAKVQVTAAHHQSWWEFKICPATSNNAEVSQSCLDSNVLDIEGHGRRYNMPFRTGDHNLRLKLPQGLKCDRCVIQWTYHSENTLEMYRACSDVRVGDGGNSGGDKGGQGGQGGNCQSFDTPCKGDHGSQGNCCQGLYCHKTVPTWAQGMCYNRN